MVAVGGPPTLVLLEGPSDVAALETVLARHGDGVVRDPTTGRRTAYRLVDMGGVTNIAAHLRAARRTDPTAPAPVVLGLCDEREAWVVVRALRDVGRQVEDVAGLAEHGFSVCHRDLEEELIRALGAERCLELLRSLGLDHRFRTFSAQRAWAGRPVEERLHRFCGVASGRKVRLAGAMAGALPPDAVPAPIARLVARLVGAPSPVDGRAGAGGVGAEECPP